MTEDPKPEDWLINFNENQWQIKPEVEIPADANKDDYATPFGIGTKRRLKYAKDEKPWDIGCEVEFLNGGEDTMLSICSEFKKAIDDARTASVPMGGYRGHVYIAGWRLNANRVLKHGPDRDSTDTAWSLIRDMMKVGIRVRILLWLPAVFGIPFFASDPLGFKPHQYDHIYLSNLVHSYNKQLLSDCPANTEDFGVVFLDLRTADIGLKALPPSSHHQKFIVIRGLKDSVAFCGGVDLAFTRRSIGLIEGDGQSGDYLESKNRSVNDDEVSNVDVTRSDIKYYTDLPTDVYGSDNQIWHDQHLKLKGPIVKTLEDIFENRWSDWGKAEHIEPDQHPLDLDISKHVVLSSSINALSGNNDDPIKPLSIVIPENDRKPITSIPNATSIAQAWLTIPFRKIRYEKKKSDGNSFPYKKGEFTYMAGITKACTQAKDMIMIFDQYFWLKPYSTLLAKQLIDNDNLHLIIILPPYSDMNGSYSGNRQHSMRREAYYRILADLNTAQQRNRVATYILRKKSRYNPLEWKKGIYCHSKVQIFDQSLMVCGSANINWRSFTTDTELSCAIMDKEFVRNYYKTIYKYLFSDGFDFEFEYDFNFDFESNDWAANLFSKFKENCNNNIGILTSDLWHMDYFKIPLETAPNPVIRDNRMFERTMDSIIDPTCLNKILYRPIGVDENGQDKYYSLDEIVSKIELHDQFRCVFIDSKKKK